MKLDLSVGQRLGLGFGTVLVLIVIQIAAALLWLGRIDELRQTELLVLQPRTELASELESSLLHQRNALNSYTWFGRQRDLDRYLEYAEQVQYLLQRLRSVPQGPESTKLLTSLAIEAEEYQRKAEELRAAIGRGASRQQLDKARLELGEIRERLLDGTTAYSKQQTKRFNETISEISRAQGEMKRDLLGLAALVILVFGATAVMTVRAVRQPAHVLLSAARAMERGSYAPAIALSRTASASRPGEPRQDELRELAEAFGRMASELQSREGQLAASARLAITLASTLEVERLADGALREIVGHTLAEVGAVYLRDAGSDTLRRIASYALDGAAPLLEMGEGIPGEAFREGRTIVVRDIPADTPFRLRFGFEELPPRTIVASPVSFGEQPFGVILLGSLRELDQDALSFLERSTKELGISLQNALAHQRLGQLAGDLEASNLMLQDRNEQLQVQSEELQAQSEELQAQNEEMSRTLDELRTSEQRFRQLIESNVAGIFEWEADGSITAANDAFLRIIGHDRNALEAGRLRWDHLTPPEFAELDRRALQEIEITGSCSPYEKEFLHHSGRRVPVMIGGAAYSAGSGAGFGFCLDIGEQKRLERALRDHADRLAQADQRKNEFLAMLGHELRNPLAAVANASYLLDRVCSHEKDAARLCAIISRQTMHLSRIVDDLLDVSRITRGQIELRRSEVDLGAVLQQALDLVRPLVAERRHELLLELPPQPLNLVADPERLAQVVGNLLHNSAKYTEPGGHILLGAQQEGDTVLIWVQDDGAGIAPELLPHIFDLFTQAERSLARSKGGLGIGLTLVRTIVELHGGTVRATSAGPGQGSRFEVRLPMNATCREDAPAPAAALPRLDERADHAATNHAAAGVGRHVLIIEDSSDIAEMLAEVVSTFGHSVEVASDGATGLARALADPPDIVLLDIGLPDQDGYQVARQLKDTLPPGSRTRLVALTGYCQAEDRRLAREAGFSFHLAKPVDPGELRRVLEQ